ncbi:MAG: hypothetical protein KIT09_04155 [Bryobacteraceae bacterium]|nr:hypothetical protein [Bryobacteraceae bacterium]
MSIDANHPLRRLFAGLVERRLFQDAQLSDTQAVTYIAELLAEFTHVRKLYRIRNARGQRLQDVGEMLIESNPLLEGRSFDYERAVRKHIGDYTLFLSGLFPEYVASLPRRGLRLDALVDYVKAGKESYRIVAAFDQFEYRFEAPLFRRLSDSFELCVYGLNLVKTDLERFQQGYYRGLRSALGSE